MRWEYAGPRESVILLDGETVRMYDAEEQKLQIASASPETLSPTALGFLLGDAKLREVFAAERLEPNAPDELRLNLRPRGEAP